MVGLLLLLVAGRADAQTSTVPHEPSFSVDRLTPAPGPGGFFQVEDATLLRDGSWGASAVSSLTSRPLVIRRLGGEDETLTEPVALRLGLDLGFAYGWRDRAQIGLALPVVAFQDGDRLQGLGLMEPGADASLAVAGIGDLRLHGKLALWAPRRGYGAGLALASVLTVPTGDDGDFAGEAGFTVELRGVASYRAPGWRAAANLGGRLRGDKVIFFNPSMTLGNELTWGAAASLRLPIWRRQEPTALVEVAGAWGGADGPSPAEARAGLRARLGRYFTGGVSAGAGIGDARAIGAPTWRATVDLYWERAPRADLDGDDVPDALDRCPEAAEDADGRNDADGCPDPDDDGDGVLDVDDKCPVAAEDMDRFRDFDGCPEADNDGDGVLDADDKCPVEAEDPDGFSDEDGCPDKDNDADGVPDEADACKLEPEDRDGNADDDGCPDLDDDGDGVPDTADKCPTQAEDHDGWLDEDGCFDGDDDRDGVPDVNDRCPEAPETIRTPEDREADGCPDGRAMAEARPDGSIWLSPAAQAELKGGPDADRVALAIARAAVRAGWNEASGDALVVTVPGDQPVWSPLAEKRSGRVVRVLAAEGVRARVESIARPRGVGIHATPEALEAGKAVMRKGK